MIKLLRLDLRPCSNYIEPSTQRFARYFDFIRKLTGRREKKEEEDCGRSHSLSGVRRVRTHLLSESWYLPCIKNRLVLPRNLVGKSGLPLRTITLLCISTKESLISVS